MIEFLVQYIQTIIMIQFQWNMFRRTRIFCSFKDASVN